jgi:HrpA-like RNA helicase
MNKHGINNRVLVLKAETASGKSTAFPPYLYKTFIRGKSVTHGGIICTQPRVLTAIENVNDMIANYDFLRISDNIGWSTKYNKMRFKMTGLISATIGTLAQQLKMSSDADIISKYQFILIDETHERDLQTDMVLSMLKNLLIRNHDNINCPFVVLMSATFDPASFLNYYSVNGSPLPLLENFIWCRGATAHITEMWDWNLGRTVNDYPRAAAQVVEEILNKGADDEPGRADILIFMPGKTEFKATAKWLTSLNTSRDAAGKSVFTILRMDGAAVSNVTRDYTWALSTPLSNQFVEINGRIIVPERAVIIASVVAETGITLPRVKYIIDSGYNREIEYNPVFNVRGLITKPAPQSRVRQRRGRVGRKFPGVFYPLYPKYIHDKLPELQLPQILTEDISTICLDMVTEQIRAKSLNGGPPLFSVDDIDMVDNPTADSMLTCSQKLYSYGYININNSTWELTDLGQAAAKLSPLPLEITRMILAGYAWGTSIMDLISISAYLLMGSGAIARDEESPAQLITSWDAIYSDVSIKIQSLIADDFIDGIYLFAAMQESLEGTNVNLAMKSLREWSKRAKVSMKACVEFIKIRDDLIEQMLIAGFNIYGVGKPLLEEDKTNFMDAIVKIKHCIYDGFRDNLLILSHDSNYYTSMVGARVELPALFKDRIKATPKYVICKELSLKYNHKTGVYDIFAGHVSTMDGFVSVDEDFIL